MSTQDVTPPAAAGSAIPGNLPSVPTPLIGRRREAREVGARLSEARLVTLTGAGGSGKTRLALHVAQT
ncbi:MAG: ATP-binding protein, partial [Caldilineales bacterium]|nr:ATP-binding protein [Caldilineales bacterium]